MTEDTTTSTTPSNFRPKSPFYFLSPGHSTDTLRAACVQQRETARPPPFWRPVITCVSDHPRATISKPTFLPRLIPTNVTSSTTEEAFRPIDATAHQFSQIKPRPWKEVDGEYTQTPR